MTVLNPEGVGSVTACVLHPTNAAGASAPIFNVEWTVDRADVVAITPAESDGQFSCKVEAVPGAPLDITAIVSVKAKSKAGADLADSAQFSVHVDDEAVTLGLTVG